MKLTKKQKSAIFKVFAERLWIGEVGCSFCKHFMIRGEKNQCQSCDDEYSKWELTDDEANKWYWADIEAALENKVQQSKTTKQ